MNQEEEEQEAYWETDATLPEATVGGCLLDIATVGLALFSMGGGIAASALAINGLIQHQPDTMAIALQLGGLPHSLLVLLGGFVGQLLLAFVLFTFQLHRQVRAVLPGMALIGVIAVLLLLIGLTA